MPPAHSVYLFSLCVCVWFWSIAPKGGRERERWGQETVASGIDLRLKEKREYLRFLKTRGARTGDHKGTRKGGRGRPHNRKKKVDAKQK